MKALMKKIRAKWHSDLTENNKEILNKIDSLFLENRDKENGAESPDHKIIWSANIKDEIDDWEKVIGGEWSKSQAGMDWATYKNANIIPEKIAGLLPAGSDEVSICDVGSGPRCWMGNILPPPPHSLGPDTAEDRKLTLVCCDPLAQHYSELFKKYGIDQVVPCIAINAENLLERFRYNQFDVVTARNCLDHSFSPEICILQMAAVSKKYVYLLHCVDEGENADYQGLHQWNFRYEEGNFLINNKNGETVNFSLKYKHLFNFKYNLYYKKWRELNQHWFEIILEKKQNSGDVV